MTKEVHKNEPGCLRYELIERTNGEDGLDLVVLER